MSIKIFKSHNNGCRIRKKCHTWNGGNNIELRFVYSTCYQHTSYPTGVELTQLNSQILPQESKKYMNDLTKVFGRSFPQKAKSTTKNL